MIREMIEEFALMRLSTEAGWKKQKAGRRYDLIINIWMNMTIHR